MLGGERGGMWMERVLWYAFSDCKVRGVGSGVWEMGRVWFELWGGRMNGVRYQVGGGGGVRKVQLNES